MIKKKKSKALTYAIFAVMVQKSIVTTVVEPVMAMPPPLP